MRESNGIPPRFLNQATRMPLKLRSSGPEKRGPGSLIEMGQRGSGPAIALRNNATSDTVRPIGPKTLSVDRSGLGTRPGAVLRPTTPQNAAGFRSEPPLSEPSARGTIPQAKLTAEPPLLPPQVFVKS